MGEKFWVLGYSGGGPYTWGALRYIPHRLAGVAMFAPMGNPYAKNFTEEESTAIWKEMNGARRVMFRLAHYLPSLLPAYMQTGLMGKPVTVIKLVTKAASPKDFALLETDRFGWGLERSMRESMRSGDAKPHAQGVILHCQDWGFELADLRPTKDSPVFSGPIHIFHGTEDSLVPLVMSQFAKRMIPELHLHILEGHGHFSWFCYCDSCHWEFFRTLFGDVEGLDELELEQTSATPSDVAPTTPAPKEVTQMQAAVSSEADANTLEERNVVISDDEL
jgi:pimeloyl-ACP methyl ester carboxylesterase